MESKRSLWDLSKELQNIWANDIQKRWKWKHNRTGDIYVIRDVGFVEKDMTIYIAYRPKEYNFVVFSRPLPEFLEKFTPIEETLNELPRIR